MKKSWEYFENPPSSLLRQSYYAEASKNGGFEGQAPFWQRGKIDKGFFPTGSAIFKEMNVPSLDGFPLGEEGTEGEEKFRGQVSKSVFASGKWLILPPKWN